MAAKTVLLVDDELGYLEPLEDALVSEGYVVLKASTGEEALQILKSTTVNLVSLDVMFSPGESLRAETSSSQAGLYFAETITQRYPKLDVFCLSVVSDLELIRKIESLGVRFIRKGETPLRTVLNMMRSRLTGIAYSTDRDTRK